MSSAIIVRGLSKQFRRYHIHKPRTLQEAVQRGLRRLRPSDYFWSLHDINFEVPRGRTVGVIGPNGAGKSTLLRLVGGVGLPTQGLVTVNGRIGALLDLGAGFHPELTGRENVFVSAIIGGLRRKEVQEKLESIVAFSELNEFIDYPLHTYSSGMQMRLAFSVAVHVEPEILLIDEVLSVGDLSFERKSMGKISEFRAKGCTILMASHDLGAVRDLCDEALFLRGGQLVAHGPVGEVIDRYRAEENGSEPQFSPEARAVEAVTDGVGQS
jgi:lipopolysaccharide transport system ATP-binding protein